MAFVCCKSQQDHKISLFNEIFFNLKDGEELATIDINKKDIFNSYFEDKSIQIPLFKCISSNNYLIFIGIPYNTSIKELYSDNLTHSLNMTYSESDSINYFYKAYNNDNEQITIYTQNFSNNLVYVLTVSNSAELSDSLFNIDKLSNRFLKSKL